MTTWRFPIEVEVDDEALADPNCGLPKDPTEWYTQDLIDAINDGIAEYDHIELSELGVVLRINR